MILVAINERMLEFSSITDIVEDKIYSISIDQKVSAPAIAYNAVTVPNRSKSGNVGNTDECLIVTISKSISELAELNKAVVDAFDNRGWSTPEFSRIRGTVESITRKHIPEYEEYQGEIRIILKSNPIKNVG